MKKRGRVSFVFDDGYTKTYDNAIPLLEKHGWHGVFALPIKAAGIAEKTSLAIKPWQEWDEAAKTGHEIAAHSVHHVDLATLSSEALADELRIPAETLKASTIIYPGGSYNDNVVNQTKQYYKAGRTLERGLETMAPKNPYALRSYDFTQANFRLWKVNILALWAYITNSWLIETYHLVDEEKTSFKHTVHPALLARHFDFVAQLPIDVTTIKEVVS